MDCPRCGTRDVTTPECPACGVMVAKARSVRPRPERTLPPTSAPSPAWRSLLLPAPALTRRPAAPARTAPAGADDAAGDPARRTAPDVRGPGASERSGGGRRP